MSENKNKPEMRYRIGGISATIFRNVGKTKDGKEFDFATISLQRGYKDKNDEWKNESINLRSSDIDKVRLVLDAANTHINLKTEN